MTILVNTPQALVHVRTIQAIQVLCVQQPLQEPQYYVAPASEMGKNALQVIKREAIATAKEEDAKYDGINSLDFISLDQMEYGEDLVEELQGYMQSQDTEALMGLLYSDRLHIKSDIEYVDGAKL